MQHVYTSSSKKNTDRNIDRSAMAESEHSIHVLLAAYPAQGHINPLLQLAKRLAGQPGVRCTLAVTRSSLGPSGGASLDAGAVHVAAFSDGCDQRGYDEVGDVRLYLARLDSAGSSSLDGLLRSEAEQGRPVHALVYDAFLLFAPRVARRHGAKCAAYFTQACAVNLVYAHAWAGLLGVPVDKDSAPASPMPGIPTPLSPADFPSFLTDTAAPAYLDLLLQQCRGLEVADYNLINSFDELQPKEAEYLASRWGAMTVGPSVPSAYLDNRVANDTSYGFQIHTPMAAECKAWLDGRLASSVVYVSFGSLATPQPAQVAEVAEGLYGSGAPFLWVVRASEAWKLPPGFLDKVNNKADGRGLLVTWSPQLEVLAHPAVGCFVTHCGWNSTMEALSIGVPMVTVPQWADQPTNAKYIEDVWHVGVRVKGAVTKEELTRCVREVMDDGKGYRTNAASWSHKAKKAMSAHGSSDTNITHFLSRLRLGK
ncbi:UDP-glucosyltransferase UGT13248-like [Triticum dicoccoides]|uniref:UDP-glucosyltransferase UGT13248-like n=1 Tax=Triticum dicoccoides TaxID=85692 RepID=UPI00188EC920|nr:UDP-glucosyltransferase UGT13248-like [Triticum dicoccoides]